MDYIVAFLEFQSTFDFQPVVRWMERHTEVPIFAAGAYLWMVHWVGTREFAPLKLRGLFALWNICLSVFSIIGMYHTVPELISYLLDSNKGLHYSVCVDPRKTFYNGPVGFWIVAFMLSKIPEMLDTALLIAQKKPVIFLHWYHHITVMLYCWHAFLNNTSGLWFAAMNYSVHAVMYAFFGLMALNLKRIAAPFAQFITTIQIVQMVIGTTIAVYQLYVQDDDQPEKCSVVASNAKMAIAMYASYFVLFAQLFVKKYSRKERKSNGAPASPATGPTGTPLTPSPASSASPVASITKAMFTTGKKLKQ